MDEANAILGTYSGTMTTSYLGGAIQPESTSYSIALNVNPLNPSQFFLGVVTFKVGNISVPAINLSCQITESPTGGYNLIGNGPLQNITIQGFNVSKLDVSGTILNGKLSLKLNYTAASLIPVVNSTFEGTK
jgi:hypothetical protein